MKQIKFFCSKLRKEQIICVILLAVGAFVRLWQLGAVPGGINQDEAFAGYEAYSLLHYGKDSFGYSFPVYFVAWGSGMNVLNSYLMIPFMAVFGAQTWVVRLPQALTACFTLLVFYLLLKKVFNEKTAVMGLFLLVISPWHIMLARWGLESNLAPGFLLFGFYFFVLGIDKSRYYIISALFYGLSLYCYGTIWTIVPVMLILQAGYLFYTNRLKLERNIILAVLLLVLLALPLILFLIINMGYMEEIRTPFLSIPKLPVARISEVSLVHIPENFKTLCQLIIRQNDGMCWNATAEYGLYYKETLPFAVLGFCYCAKDAFISLKKKKFDYSVLLMVPFFCALLLGCLISVNVNRINCIHLWIILFMTVGVCRILQLLKEHFSHAAVVLCGMFVLAFVSFENYYFNEYKAMIAPEFQEGLEQALDAAKDLAEDGETIYVSPRYSYAKVLFYEEVPVDEYLETVSYVAYPASFLLAASCEGYCFEFDECSLENIYIVNPERAEEYQNSGFTVDVYGNAAVAYCR